MKSHVRELFGALFNCPINPFLLVCRGYDPRIMRSLDRTEPAPPDCGLRTLDGIARPRTDKNFHGLFLTDLSYLPPARLRCPRVALRQSLLRCLATARPSS